MTGNRIALHPLTFVDEGDQTVIGRPDIDSFAVFPEDAAAVVWHLQSGATVDEVGDWYLRTYGEPADIEDLVATLLDLEFVRDPASDGPNTAGPADAAPKPVRWTGLGKALFAPPAWALYALVVAAAVSLLVRTPELRPTPSKTFFSTSLVLVQLTLFAVDVVGITVHEGFHVLAGRRLGLPSRLSIGRRLYFIVAQTTLTGLMGVPRGKRILPFCAGLVADSLFFSALVGTAEADRVLHGTLTVLGRAAIAIAYVTLLRMAWQCMVFMETDLYHVLTTALRCPDLHRLSRTYLRNRLWRSLRRPERLADESGWTPHDLKTARRYAPFMVVGSAVLIAYALCGAFPVLIGFLTRAYQGMTTGQVSSPHFWDSMVAGATLLGQLAALIVIKIRSRIRRKTPPTPARRTA